MADSKLTALTALTGATIATGDVFEVTDISDTTMDASGTSKKISLDELAKGLAALGYVKPAPGHLPSGALAATFDRQGAAASAQTILTSGTLFLFQITLLAGQVITSISMRSGSQAAVTPTHQFFGIADINRAVQRWTSDDTTTAWGTTTVKTLNLTTTYTVPSSGDYYLALMVAAATPPNIICFNGLSGNLTNIAPNVCGNTSDTGLTTPPTLAFTAGAITPGTQAPYAWVS